MGTSLFDIHHHSSQLSVFRSVYDELGQPKNMERAIGLATSRSSRIRSGMGASTPQRVRSQSVEIESSSDDRSIRERGHPTTQREILERYDWKATATIADRPSRHKSDIRAVLRKHRNTSHLSAISTVSSRPIHPTHTPTCSESTHIHNFHFENDESHRSTRERKETDRLSLFTRQKKQRGTMR